MAYNKFQTREEETVFLDLINDNITETNVLSGVTFHKADGTAGIGVLSKDSNFFKVTDDDVMSALLAADNVGKVAQFNGTSDTYVDGGYYLIESAVYLISFNIGYSTYQAEEGMTWGEWVNSGYNKSNYFIVFDVNVGIADAYVGLNGTRVETTETITSNGQYEIIGGGTND